MSYIYRLAATIVAALLLAGSLAPAFTNPSEASADWCWDDPIVSVGGRLLDIRVGMPLANLLTMRSTTLTVIIPSNVQGAVIVDDISAFPMETRISRTGPAWNGKDSIPISIVARVTASTHYPISVIATPVTSLSGGLQSTLGNTLGLLSPTSVSGWSNTTVTMPMSLR